RVAGGAGVVKVILTGSVDLERGVAPPAHFHSEELRRMVETAHELGVAVAVHANGAQAVTMAAEAGVDSVEHGILIDEESVRAMVDHDVVWVPTLTPLHALAVSGRWAAVPRIIAAHEAMVAAGHAAGVRIAAGTDAGSPGVAHGAVLSEVAHLRSAGLSPEAARAAVGAVAADLLGLGGGYGRLSRGAATDLVWFKQDPFADPSPDNARAPRPLGVLSSPRPTASVGARMR
ncbi:MAG TPA: amidohydrolase family protein, partial [Thermoleophilia bacterium]|nr:amidohydrolase family protein [Thermoleophilia bacterium]